jgi:hypothetical protein
MLSFVTKKIQHCPKILGNNIKKSDTATYFRQQLKFLGVIKNFLVAILMEEIEPLLIGRLNFFKQHPKTICMTIENFQLPNLMIEKFQSLKLI